MNVLNKVKVFIKDVNNVSIKISKNTGKNKLFVTVDIVMCLIKYQASPNNYYYFQFYSIKGDCRKTFVTHGLSEKIIKTYNNPKYIDIFEDKLKFAHYFSKYFGRNYINLKTTTIDEFKVFINNNQNKNKIIYKPTDAAQGQGIEVIEIKEFDNINKIYEYLKNRYSSGIVEECINQHSEISKIYPGAVNVVRVITICKNGTCNILTANLTIGNGGKIANACLSDLVALVNVNTGELITICADLNGNSYEYHPLTGTKIKGFKIPYWNGIVHMLNHAAKMVPEVGYVGWDIAITPDGPIIVEGNTTPGYKFFQLPELLPNHVGHKESYQKFI